MARKHIFDLNSSNEEHNGPEKSAKPNRPLAGMPKSSGSKAVAVGALSKSLGSMSEKADKAAELEAQLKAGQTIVELDPDLVDRAFAVDRLGTSEKDDAELIESIKDIGQQSPILVRPHPSIQGRYQIAYGHRRLAAAQSLGIKVKAVIRELADDELIISQGQENSSRADLSFIEKAYFAYRLEKSGFRREIILKSLGIHKAVLSKMISIADRAGASVIEKIGPAKSVGRGKWEALAALLEQPDAREKAIQFLDSDDAANMSSEALFEAVVRLSAKPKTNASSDTWQLVNGAEAIKISNKKAALNLSFNKSKDAGFGDYLLRQLPELIAQFESEQGKNK